jgi:hypothetical protein
MVVMKTIFNKIAILVVIILTISVCSDASRIREVETIENGHICLDNTTDVPLGSGGVFVGPYQDTLNYNVIIVGIIADQDSATDGLVIRWSADGVNVTQTDEFSILANKGKVFTFSPANQYVSIEYTNGAVAQTLFSIQTIFKKAGFKASSHRISDSIIGDDDAELVKSVLTGEDDNGVFQNVETTEDGVLKISDESSGLAIAKGDVTGTTFEHKFGNAPDFDSTDLTVTVWDGAEDGTAWENMVYDYSTTADIDSISSSNAGDTQEITVVGQDINYNIVTQTKTLNGQTRVALDTPLFRCYRAYNSNATNLAGHVFVYVNGATTGGVPNNNDDIRAIIDPINQQTEMAIYTVPAGKTGYMRSWYAATAGASKNANYFITLKSREATRVFRVKHTSALNETGTSAYQHTYVEPEVFPEKTDIEMTVSILGTGVTAASVSAGFDMVLVDN